MDELPAPDGEEYFVMALYFAANRWGNGKGIYDYEAHADRLLRRHGAPRADHRHGAPARRRCASTPSARR